MSRPDGRFARRPLAATWLHASPRRARETRRDDDLVDLLTPGPSLEEAIRLVGVVTDTARRVGCRQTIVVVDALGDIVTQARMNGAWREAGDIALTKASAACAFDLPTHHLAQLGHPGLELFRGATPEWRILAGGVPLRRDGAVVGGIGVAGGSADEDRICAEAAAVGF